MSRTAAAIETAPPAASAVPALLSLHVDPRARLVLFDIADDPCYAAMEVQVFDDDVQGTGLLVLMARHDATVDVYQEAGIRLERDAFSIGRGVRSWQTTAFDPGRVEIHADGIAVEVGFTDMSGQRVDVRIDDRDGVTRHRSTLLAPVSSGVESPRQLLVVLLREFDLVRTGGKTPRLTIGGVDRRSASFPGPTWLHRRRFIRSSGAPVIVRFAPDVDGPVAPASLGPLERLEATTDTSSAAVRFDPSLPDLRALTDGAVRGGAWALDVAHVADLFGGTWTAARQGDRVRLTMDVTRPWAPHDLPLSLRAVTTVARVFREWPLSYRWTADVDVVADPPVARSRWTRTTGPDRANAYGLRGASWRRATAPVAALAAQVAVVALLVAAVRRIRRRRARP